MWLNEHTSAFSSYPVGVESAMRQLSLLPLHFDDLAVFVLGRHFLVGDLGDSDRVRVLVVADLNGDCELIPFHFVLTVELHLIVAHLLSDVYLAVLGEFDN